MNFYFFFFFCYFSILLSLFCSFLSNRSFVLSTCRYILATEWHIHDANGARFKSELTLTKNNFWLHYPFRQWCCRQTWIVFSTCVEKWKMLSLANRFVIQSQLLWLSWYMLPLLLLWLRHTYIATEAWSDSIAVRIWECVAGKVIWLIFNRIVLFTLDFFYFNKIYMIPIAGVSLNW